MSHLPPLIQDLAIILMTAAIVTLLCRQLRQPAVVGYLLAGFLVGPGWRAAPIVTDLEGIRTWGDIGVLVLLFAIGLEFNLKKLMNSGRAAMQTGIFEISVMMAIGFAIGRALGWGPMNSLFLGGLMSISSTTIIYRSLKEQGLTNRPFAPLVMGVLIVEDIVAVLLLVLLTTVAVTKTLEGAALLDSAARLTFFLVLWIVLGTLLVPKMIRRVSRLLSDETALVVGLGLCFLMVVVAASVGFSPALGAFVMGSLLSETDVGPRIEHLIRPVRDLFGAVFFVSIGMQIDPAAIADSPGTIVIVLFAVWIGRSLAPALGALLAGEPLARSLQAGFSLAQIGEFSFLIAAAGVDLGVVDRKLSTIAITASALTVATTPFFIAHSGRWALWIEGRVPLSWRRRLDATRASRRARAAEGIGGELLRKTSSLILVNVVLAVAVVLAFQKFVLPALSELMDPDLASGGAVILALLLASPFIWGLAAGHIEWSDAARQRLLVLKAVAAVRVLLAVTIPLWTLTRFLSPAGALSLVVLAAVASPIWLRVQPVQRASQKFQHELRESFRAGGEKTAPAMAPWDASLIEFTVAPHSPVAGMTLEESAVKERFGVTVALVERGGRRILGPGRETQLLPGDRVSIIGTDSQLERVGHVLTPLYGEVAVEETPETVNYGLASLTVRDGFEFARRPLKDSGLREQIDGLLVGLEREGQRVLNPDSSTIIQPGDLLWLVGNLDKIRALGGSTEVRG